jgi:lantibiotic leader peptide-processing serine protease
VLLTAAVLCRSGLVSVAAASPSGVNAATPPELTAICEDLFAGTPTSAPVELATSCTNKAAIVDLYGHGTHVASIAAAPVNGIGIAGVVPEATLVALKACTAEGFCFADSVAAVLRYAGDQRLDVVNMSLFADPYLYFCRNEAEQRAMLKELQSAARYAQQRGVLLVASAGNEADDLQHPTIDEISPDYPPDSAETRRVRNNCRVAPADLPGITVVDQGARYGFLNGTSMAAPMPLGSPP